MKDADPKWRQNAGGDENFQEFCWLRTKNIILEGFDPNMALSFAWNIRPAVVFDLDLFNEDARRFNDLPFTRFEDLFYYSASSIYNRRSLCWNYYRTLNKQTILTNADYVLVSLGRDNAAEMQIPGFHSAGKIGTGASTIQLLVADNASKQSYRAIYERELLRSGANFPSQDMAAIYFDLAIDESLHQDFSGLKKLFADYPLQQNLLDDDVVGIKNIYWIADDIQLKKIMVPYLRSFAAQQLGSPASRK